MSIPQPIGLGVRRTQLSNVRAYPKRHLVALVRQLRPYSWFANPIERFRHEELVTLVLEAEYPDVCTYHEQERPCQQCANPHKGDPSLDPELRHEEKRGEWTFYFAHDGRPVTARCPRCPADVEIHEETKRYAEIHEPESI